MCKVAALARCIEGAQHVRDSEDALEHTQTSTWLSGGPQGLRGRAHLFSTERMATQAFFNW